MRYIDKFPAMLTPKKLVILIVVVGMVVFVISCVQKPGKPTPPEVRELKLSYFPEVFKENTVIVIGDNASEIEMRAAKDIASYLENEAGNKSLVKKYSEVSDEDKRNYNLIVVGTLKSNPFLEEIYAMTNATRVNESFPGEGKGILEILRNPWNEEKAMLLVEGWDEWGVKAGSEMLKEVQNMNKVYVAVEWNGINAIFPRSIPQDKYILLGLHQEISGSRLRIDFPPLIRFDRDSGILECESCEFEINDELSIVILNTIELKEPGSGGGGGLIPIYTLPDSRNLPFLMKIKSIEPNGTVYLSYGNTDITLQPKEYYIGKFREEWRGEKVICNFRIENYGLYGKELIKLGGRE